MKHSKARILVVEDETALLTMLRYNLEKHGYRVEEAGNGEEALTWTEEEWDGRLRASALRRIQPWMWRRNLRAAVGEKPTDP
jgi:DNA-binding response OmpR family regulator